MINGYWTVKEMVLLEIPKETVLIKEDGKNVLQQYEFIVDIAFADDFGF